MSMLNYLVDEKQVRFGRIGWRQQGGGEDAGA